MASDLSVPTRCPACDAQLAHRIVVEDVEDFWEGVPGTWGFEECAVCNSLVLSPRPAPHAMARAYASYYTHASARDNYDADNGEGLAWSLVNDYLNHRYGAERRPAFSAGRWLVPLFPPLRRQLDFFYRELPRIPGTVLDVGCGNGVFLLSAKAAGWQVAGVEPDLAAASRAEDAGVQILADDLRALDGAARFDVVTSSNVIEHVPDPSEFLARIYKALSPGGMLWLATPNAYSQGRRAYGRYWRGLEAPRHCVIFSPNALISTVANAGFVEVRLRPRGRGSHFAIDESVRYASARFAKVVRAPNPKIIDFCAAFDPTCSEELVLVARKPL